MAAPLKLNPVPCPCNQFDSLFSPHVKLGLSFMNYGELKQLCRAITNWRWDCYKPPMKNIWFGHTFYWFGKKRFCINISSFLKKEDVGIQFGIYWDQSLHLVKEVANITFFLKDELARERYEKKSKAIKDLDDKLPGQFPRTYGSYQEICEGHLFQEYFEKTLFDIYQNRATIPLPIRITLCFFIAKNIEALHLKRIVHRDVKLQNCLVTLDGEKPVAKLTDFEFTGSIDEPNALKDQSCSPRYAAPELFLDSDLPPDLILARDIWAFGVLLYKLLDLDIDVPWDSVSLQDRKKLIPAFAFGAYPKKEGLLELLTAKMLAFDPKKRPSATFVQTALFFEGRRQTLLSGK